MLQPQHLAGLPLVIRPGYKVKNTLGGDVVDGFLGNPNPVAVDALTGSVITVALVVLGAATGPE